MGLGRGLQAVELATHVSLQSVDKQPVVGHAEPVVDLLFLLRADAAVFVEKLEKRRLGGLQHRVRVALEAPEVGKNALLELFAVFDRPSKRLEPEADAAHNVCAGDVVETLPQHAGDELFGRQVVASDDLARLPIGGGCRQKEFHWVSGGGGGTILQPVTGLFHVTAVVGLAESSRWCSTCVRTRVLYTVCYIDRVVANMSLSTCRDLRKPHNHTSCIQPHHVHHLILTIVDLC